ncbi:alpha-galactosidase, partial [Salmonella enterica]|uniref:alpha-galactosidase n=1 Tax=Salmonella enterica TaxID=28901 RepID=UPI003298B55A
MTNTASELYEQHPDWVLKADNRNLVTGRGGTQLVLDLSNPEVQDFVVGVVDGIMEENPDIAYI